MSKTSQTAILVLFLLALACPCLAQQTTGNGLLVGAAMRDISPNMEVAMGGYGMFVGSKKNCRWSTGVHDPLYATAIYLQKGDDILVLIEVDLLGLVSMDVDDIREGVAQKLSISNGQIIVGASHTHHGPDTIGLWGTVIPAFSGRNEKYMKMAKDEAIRVAIDAYEARKNAKLFYAAGEEAKLHYNIYSDKTPKATIDHTLTVVKTVDDSGAVFATITNWGCHATTEQAENRLVSADWVGPFRDKLAKTHPGVHMVVIGSIGAAIQPSVPWRDANIGNRGQGFVWTKAVGEKLAENALSLMENAAALEFDRIEIVNRPVPAKMKNFAFSLAGSSGQVRMGLPTYGAAYETRITAVAMGDLRIGTMPGEISPQIGNRIRERLGGKAQILVGLGQDWLGYVIDEDQYYDRVFAYERFLCLDPKLGASLVKAYDGVSF